ncbi:MAG: ERCC4 domain-containing protein [Nanoarchaeota archaeon]
MFYNIFRKLKKNKKNKIPLIIADIHEKNSLVISELYKSPEISLEIKSLKIADYIIKDIAIERKTVSDLISSMINKRLIQQLKQIKIYNKSLLIIEGDLDKVIDEENNISKALRGLLISISINHKIPIIRTKDYEDTAKYLITLAKQQLKEKIEISLHSRIPKTKKEQKSYVLESFPNVGPVKAKKLIEKFNNLLNIINATEEDLKPILKKRAKEFKDLINS